MRSSRAPTSSSSVSSKSYASERSRHRTHSSRHSIDSESSPKSSSKMRFIIVIGIALPIIAAIIGIVAWAVSADSAFQGSDGKTLRRSDTSTKSQEEEDIFQIMENRHEMAYSRYPAPSHQDNHHDSELSRLDTNQNNHQQNQFDDPPEKDPLYIVHFVPSPKPKTEASTSGPGTSSTVADDMLKKILSVSKGAKPGTPQFVVFAPMPGEEDTTEKMNDMNLGASGLNFLSKPPPHKTEMDYDYEEELRKYQEILDSKDNSKNTVKVGENLRKTTNQADILKETIRLISQNFSSGNAHQSFQQSQPRTESSNIGLNFGDFTKPSSQAPNYLQPEQGYTQPNINLEQQNYQNVPQAYPNTQQNQISQHTYQAPQQVVNYPQQMPSYPQQQTINYPQQQMLNSPPQQAVPYSQPPLQDGNYAQPQNQPIAVQRSGQYEPLGIKFSIGNNNGQSGGLLGGMHSPLGIISSILSPVIRRPKVNLNGKLMFGVMLEKGVKLGGDDKGHAAPVQYG